MTGVGAAGKGKGAGAGTPLYMGPRPKPMEKPILDEKGGIPSTILKNNKIDIKHVEKCDMRLMDTDLKDPVTEINIDTFQGEAVVGGKIVKTDLVRIPVQYVVTMEGGDKKLINTYIYTRIPVQVGPEAGAGSEYEKRIKLIFKASKQQLKSLAETTVSESDASVSVGKLNAKRVADAVKNSHALMLVNTSGTTAKAHFWSTKQPEIEGYKIVNLVKDGEFLTPGKNPKYFKSMENYDKKNPSLPAINKSKAQEKYEEVQYNVETASELLINPKKLAVNAPGYPAYISKKKTTAKQALTLLPEKDRKTLLEDEISRAEKEMDKFEEQLNIAQEQQAKSVDPSTNQTDKATAERERDEAITKLHESYEEAKKLTGAAQLILSAEPTLNRDKVTKLETSLNDTVTNYNAITAFAKGTPLQPLPKELSVALTPGQTQANIAAKAARHAEKAAQAANAATTLPGAQSSARIAAAALSGAQAAVAEATKAADEAAKEVLAKRKAKASAEIIKAAEDKAAAEQKALNEAKDSLDAAAKAAADATDAVNAKVAAAAPAGASAAAGGQAAGPAGAGGPAPTGATATAPAGATATAGGPAPAPTGATATAPAPTGATAPAGAQPLPQATVTPATSPATQAAATIPAGGTTAGGTVGTGAAAPAGGPAAATGVLQPLTEEERKAEEERTLADERARDLGNLSPSEQEENPAE